MSGAWLDRDERGDLRVTEGSRPPPRGAGRACPSIVDPAGAAARVRLTLVPPSVSVPFDDPAAVQARRRVLAGPPARFVSTLVREDRRFMGAVLGYDLGDPGVGEDPFAWLGPATVHDVPSGVFGVVPPPAGAVVERHGGARPWPVERFP